MSMKSTTVQGSITAAQPTAGAFVEIECIQTGTVGIQITGSFSATLTFEATLDGTNWFTAPAYTVATTPAAATGATSGGQWQASTAGYSRFRVNCPTTFVSGPAVVNLCPSLAPAWTT